MKRFVILASVAILVLAQDGIAQDSDRYVYEHRVVGKSQKNPTERPWGVSHPDKDLADKELAALERYYYGGLGDGSTDKPIGLHVVSYRYPIGRPGSIEEVPPDALPSPGTPPAPPAVFKLGGSTWIGEEAGGKRSLRIQFKEFGQAVVTDQDDTWYGTWHLIGETNVVIQLTKPSAINYGGRIRGNVLSGMARIVRSGATFEWSTARAAP